jgi:hypothetical protein
MPERFASGKYAIAQCDRCDGRYMLKELKKEVIKTKLFSIKVCPSCWDPDQPQLSLGLYPVNDPQALREPRPDTSYLASGIQADGSIGEGSRTIQWGWNPIGGASYFDSALTPNDLIGVGQVGTLTVTTT